MMLLSPQTHAAYVRMFNAVQAAGEMRSRALAALFPNGKPSTTYARLRAMVACGYLVEVPGSTSSFAGGRLLRVGKVPIPPYDDTKSRRVYEHAARCYAALATFGEAGTTSPTLHAEFDAGCAMSVTASRLLAWERKGKAACDRSVYPHRWRALLPALPGFDALVEAEADRRAKQLISEPMREAAAAASARARMRRENDRIDAMAAAMPVAGWIAPLVPKRREPTSQGAGA